MGLFIERVEKAPPEPSLGKRMGGCPSYLAQFLQGQYGVLMDKISVACLNHIELTAL